MSQLQEKAEQAQQTGAAAPTIRGELERYRPNLAVALPPGFPGGVDRFARIIQTAISHQPALAGCTPRSIIGAAIQSAQLGLTPNLMGQCWILPYRNKRQGTIEAQYQTGWKGLVELAGRAGIRIDAHTVHEHDEFRAEYGSQPILVHQPAFDRDRGPSVLWYAVAHFTDGTPSKFEVVDRAHVEKRRKASQSPDSPAWTDWYDEMALGKAVRALCRTLKLTVELGHALNDERVIDVGEFIDIDSPEGEGDAQP